MLPDCVQWIDPGRKVNADSNSAHLGVLHMKNTFNSSANRFQFTDKLSAQRKLILDDFRIVTGARPEAGLSGSSELIRLKIKLLRQKVLSHPKQCRLILEPLIKEYPHLPVFYLLMAESYHNEGKGSVGDRWIAKCCKKFPEYIWSKIKYAENCLEKKKYKAIPKIFNNHLNIRLLYPYRSVFHVDEVTEFYGVIGLYYFYTHNRKATEDCYRLLMKVNPTHSYTRELKILLAFPDLD